MKSLKPKHWILLLAFLVSTASTASFSTWAQTPAGTPVRADVLRLNDGTIHLGTLKSFDGSFFEFQTESKLVRVPRAEVAAVVLAGAGTEVAAGPGTVKDVEGNVYKTVRIGHQVWFAENLRATKYNDGTPITLITDFQAWGKATAGAYSWYMNNIDYRPTWGALYNWKAVNTKKLCPKGWHVPVVEEWESMVNSLGGTPGARLKEVGTVNWLKNTTNVTNDTGFTALPSGTRFGSTGKFQSAGSSTAWWTATESNVKEAWYRGISDYSSLVWKYSFPKENGLSIRCVRD
ncbi:fibrobacter succinogenes major paralogous domain-containing protein [Myxococcota bacterium]|nr:fibrobacter succinogenes major paralogous domain-containing protein [Myxococcota bacterium]MBU1412544.1 fibrobacter succinogenes major paralogous domain-containing protein [Myxococcota bacterium]MBU1511637.1 fibrobacter succinogenes major paralogous domain-containing protein [Myxococcota bacterium]